MATKPDLGRFHLVIIEPHKRECGGDDAMGDPHNTPALDGILTQERDRRDISSILQRLLVFNIYWTVDHCDS